MLETIIFYSIDILGLYPRCVSAFSNCMWFANSGLDYLNYLNVRIEEECKNDTFLQSFLG